MKKIDFSAIRRNAGTTSLSFQELIEYADALHNRKKELQRATDSSAWYSVAGQKAGFINLDYSSRPNKEKAKVLAYYAALQLHGSSSEKDKLPTDLIDKAFEKGRSEMDKTWTVERDSLAVCVGAVFVYLSQPLLNPLVTLGLAAMAGFGLSRAIKSWERNKINSVIKKMRQIIRVHAKELEPQYVELYQKQEELKKVSVQTTGTQYLFEIDPTKIVGDFLFTIPNKLLNTGKWKEIAELILQQNDERIIRLGGEFKTVAEYNNNLSLINQASRELPKVQETEATKVQQGNGPRPL